MTARPPIPPDQRSDRDEKPDIAGNDAVHGKANPDPKHRGDEANIRQNLQPQRQVQDR